MAQIRNSGASHLSTTPSRQDPEQIGSSTPNLGVTPFCRAGDCHFLWDKLPGFSAKGCPLFETVVNEGMNLGFHFKATKLGMVHGRNEKWNEPGVPKGNQNWGWFIGASDGS